MSSSFHLDTGGNLRFFSFLQPVSTYLPPLDRPQCCLQLTRILYALVGLIVRPEDVMERTIELQRELAGWDACERDGCRAS